MSFDRDGGSLVANGVRAEPSREQAADDTAIADDADPRHRVVWLADGKPPNLIAKGPIARMSISMMVGPRAVKAEAKIAEKSARSRTKRCGISRLSASRPKCGA